MTTITLPPDSAGPPTASDPATTPTRRGPTAWARSFVRGRTDDAAWVRPALLVLLAGTAFLYLWDLGSSGWANTFYSAAVQAGTHSWKAFFYGSFDSSNFITVDKAPAALWAMELSTRIFGVNSWSILVPQALEGVAAVGLLYLTVRRWFTPGAGLLAGAVMALTPVAALMFRFNNPDAMLVLLLVGGAYALTRSIEDGSTKWLLLAFALVGFGFLAKMLQAFVVAPVFAGAYLLAAPPKFWRRIGQLFLAGLAMVAAAGWWVLIVELTPASARPYIGGSQNNSVLNLIFGYNGFGRLTGNETGSVGGGRGAGMWGATGWDRMFNDEFGAQASWLIPAALVLLIAGLVWTAKRPRTDRTRAALVLWGGWLVVTALTFSFGAGIIHPYYTVALAPAVGALIGIGGAFFWRRRDQFAARAVLAATVVAAAWWSWRLLERVPHWHSSLQDIVLLGGLVTAGLILIGTRLPKVATTVAVTAAVVVGLLGPAAYTWDTVTTPHRGAIPSAGPRGTGFASPGGFVPLGGLRPGGFAGPGGRAARQVPNGGPVPNGGQVPNGGPVPNGGQFPNGGVGGFGGFGGGNGRAAGGLLEGSLPSADLVAALKENAGSYTWVLATTGANRAAGYQLAADEPVMAMGGFNGTDPSPTLRQFQRYVADGKIHYFIAGGGFGGGRGQGQSTSSRITAWVEANFPSTTIGGTTVYDLSKEA